jgi:hypothetical protein
MEVKSCKGLPCIYLYLLGPKRRPSGIHGTGEEIQEYEKIQKVSFQLL